LHKKYIKNKKESGNINCKSNDKDYKRLNILKEQKYLSYLIKYEKKEFIKYFRNIIIRIPKIEYFINDFFSQLKTVTSDNFFTEEIKNIYKEKIGCNNNDNEGDDIKLLSSKRDMNNSENNNNNDNSKAGEEAKCKKITDFFSVQQKIEIDLIENEHESKNDIYNDNEMSYSLKSEESKNDSKKGRHHHHKKGFLLFPDKNFFQKRYKIISLYEFRNKEKNREKEKNKEREKEKMKEKNKVKEKSKNSTEIINEDSNKKEFVKPIPISMKQKSSFSQTLNTTKSSNKSNETNMKIRKDFKGIKSLIESKIINFDNKTKNNSNTNINLNILQ